MKANNRIRSMALGAVLLLGAVAQAYAFCGCFVRAVMPEKRADRSSGAGADLYNKASQVILVREGDRMVLTMYNDYEGDAKDFAMIVPVPVVLERNDIRVVDQGIFDKVDAFTAPRLVEKWEAEPCPVMMKEMIGTKALSSNGGGGGGGGRVTYAKRMAAMEQALGIEVDAKFTEGEYDIVLLGAKESGGLKMWLKMNGYKLPKGADEVLDPYIKEGMKFFVAKVNLKEHKASGRKFLRPLQLQYTHERFMLPIRLGMVNGKGNQDLSIFAFTRKGRVESSNYRTVKLPTDARIPHFVKKDTIFRPFCEAVFRETWDKEGRNVVVLEHAWDLSSSHSPQCSPCVAPKLRFADLREAGVWWLDSTRSGGYRGDLFVTRLHVRYGRRTFPQDLQFTVTPDQSSYQQRYYVHYHPGVNQSCLEAAAARRGIPALHRKELETLGELTGWDTRPWDSYVDQVDWRRPKEPIVLPEDPDAAAELAQAIADSLSADSAAKSEAERIKESERFLAQQAEEKKGLSTKAWLLILAIGMVLTGIVVRVLSKRQTYSSDRKEDGDGKP